MENEFDAVIKELQMRSMQAAWEVLEELLQQSIAEAAFSGKTVTFDAYGMRYICPPDMSHVGVMVL